MLRGTHNVINVLLLLLLLLLLLYFPFKLPLVLQNLYGSQCAIASKYCAPHLPHQ